MTFWSFPISSINKFFEGKNAMEVLLTQIFNGISLGSVLLLIAMGLAVTFGLMKVINMAHGELIMIGAYATYVTQNIFKSVLPEDLFGYYFILALFVSFCIAFLVGLILEFGLIRYLYGRPLDSLLATWGVGLILQQLARTIFGAPNVSVTRPDWLNGGLELIPGVVFPYNRIFIIAVVLVCIFSLYLYLYKSSNGRRVRAVMQNRDMASCLGISTRKIDSLTFAMGAGFAGVAGCILTLIGPIGPSIGTSYIIDAFMVVVVGGVGMLIGTVVSAFGIGMLNTQLEYFTSTSMGKVLIFLVIIAFLQWRPQGLISIRSRSLD